MRNNQVWLRILNVHSSEWKIVRKLFWLQFFQGAGISFFFTAEFARFLEKFPAHELPWVMVLSAVMLWLTGLVYSIYEHKIPFARFNEGIILFMAASMLLVRIGSSIITADWFYYFSLGWFYVLYLLNSLEFWGIASRLFDIRQSKRLFGLISSGDIPAKFIGYTLALVFVPYTGTLNLLILGVISMLISVPYFRNIAKSEKHHFSHGHHNKSVRHHQSNSIKGLLQNYVGSLMIRRIALISVLASACIILVNYGLYAKVKEAYTDDVALAKFIAMFMAGLRIFALITKTIFTGRLTEAIGIRSSLFITPAVIILLMVLTLSAGWLSDDAKLLFYLFGGASIAVDVLRTSINSPVLLSLMQPLPTYERLRAHNIIKGIMDPFATLFSGIVLILLYRSSGTIDLYTISYLLIILAVFWIIGIFQVNKEYLKMLINAISSRYFSQEEFRLNDPDTFNTIRNKIRTGNPSEVLSILNMVASKQNPLSLELLEDFLLHPSDEVKKETIRLIGTKSLTPLQATLENLLQTTSNDAILQETILTLSKITTGNREKLEGYLSHSNPEIKNAVITGMLLNADPKLKQHAEKELAGLLSSTTETEINTGLQILQNNRDHYDHPFHIHHLRPDSGHLRQAIQASGAGAAEETIEALLKLLPLENKLIYAALQRAGERCAAPISTYLAGNHQSSLIREKLIAILGKSGGSHSIFVLEALLKEKSVMLPVIIKALYRSKYKAQGEYYQLMENLARAYTRYGAELLNMQLALNQENTPSKLIFNAINLELEEIREIVLCLFGCLYDRDKIQKIRNSLRANKRETIANAMELIEVTVKKDIAKYFNILYEQTGIRERCFALRPLFTEKEYQQIDKILGKILSEIPIPYQDWTKACTLYISRKYGIEVPPKLFQKYLDSESIILKETAKFAIA